MSSGMQFYINTRCERKVPKGLISSSFRIQKQPDSIAPFEKKSRCLIPRPHSHLQEKRV